MKIRFFRKKDYNLRKKKILASGGLFFLLVAFFTIFTLFLHDENKAALASDWQSGCSGEGATETNIADCESWTSSSYSENTSVTSTTICVTADCSGDQVLKFEKDENGNYKDVTLFVVTNVYNGSNENRQGATATPTHLTEDQSGLGDYLNGTGADCNGGGATISTSTNSWGTPCSQAVTMSYDDFMNNANIVNGEVRFNIDTGIDITGCKQEPCYNTSITTNSQSSIIVEKPEDNKVEECPPGTQQLSKSGDELECGTVETTIDQYTKTLTRYHKTAPGEYLPKIAIDKLDYGGIPGITKYSNLSSKLIDTTVYDFYPNEENPITTESIAGISNTSKAVSAVLNSIDWGFLTDQTICAPYAIQTVGSFFELVATGIPILRENIAMLREANPIPEEASISERFVNFIEVFIQGLAITMGNEEVQSASRATALALAQSGICEQAIVGASLNGLGDRISSTIEGEDAPTPMVSEGIAYLEPGEEDTITACAYLPSNKFYYDWYVVYTQTFTTVSETTTNLTTGEDPTTKGDTYLTYMKVDATPPVRHYELTGSSPNIAKDSKRIRRLGNIYGTRFSTILETIKGNKYTGDIKGENSNNKEVSPNVEATVDKGENYDNEVSKDISKDYSEKIFAGSGRQDTIIAKYSHAATVKSDKDMTEKGCEKLSGYNIPWYVDGDLRSSSNSGPLKTLPLQLASSGTACEHKYSNKEGDDPLKVEDKSNTQEYYFSEEESINNTNIKLGSNNNVYKQRGHLASKYEIQSDKSLKETGELKAEVGFTVYRPWNYKLDFDTFTVNTDTKLADEGSVTIKAIIKNESNSSASGQEGNPSYSPLVAITGLYRINVGTKDELTGLNAQIDNCNKQNIAPSGKCLVNATEVPFEEDGVIGELDYTNGKSGEKEFTDKYTNSFEPGSHICYFAKINYSNSLRDTTIAGGYTNNGKGGDPDDAHPYFSKLSCFTVMGVPHAEIWGGSVYSGGGIHTKVYEQSRVSGGGNYIIGSWSDYGVISKGEIIGFASGKSIYGHTRDIDQKYKCSNHPLTINNRNCSDGGTSSGAGVENSVSGLGNSNIITTRTLSKLKGRYIKQPSGSSTSDATNASDLKGYYCYDSDFAAQENCDPSDSDKNKYRYSSYSSVNTTIGNITLDVGTTHIIHATGNITINGNIKYGEIWGGYKHINQIPQYIIIADGNINIREDVREINAWLIAGGTIDTCYIDDGYGNKLDPRIKDASGNPQNGVYDSKRCNSTLKINGPIFANRLELNRTSYTPGLNSSASEIFDISSFSFYWAYFQAKSSGRATTVYQRTLPPRL